MRVEGRCLRSDREQVEIPPDCGERWQFGGVDLRRSHGRAGEHQWHEVLLWRSPHGDLETLVSVFGNG